MEAPDRSDAVEPRASDHSRPGPAFGCREGVFQAPLSVRDQLDLIARSFGFCATLFAGAMSLTKLCGSGAHWRLLFKPSTVTGPCSQELIPGWHGFLAVDHHRRRRCWPGLQPT
ncbi:hypothetical protein pipiens_020167, partial [Culex pipiens pipiens]